MLIKLLVLILHDADSIPEADSTQKLELILVFSGQDDPVIQQMHNHVLNFVISSKYDHILLHNKLRPRFCYMERQPGLLLQLTELKIIHQLIQFLVVTKIHLFEPL